MSILGILTCLVPSPCKGAGATESPSVIKRRENVVASNLSKAFLGLFQGDWLLGYCEAPVVYFILGFISEYEDGALEDEFSRFATVEDLADASEKLRQLVTAGHPVVAAVVEITVALSSGNEKASTVSGQW